MWKYLSGLPAELSAVILILGIVAIVIIALRGRLKANLSKKSLELGEDLTKSPPTISSDTTSIVSIPKRSCGDCILLILAEREKFEIQIKQENNRILKTQMNFTEQKLLEIQNAVMRVVIETIHRYSQRNANSVDETIQYKLVYGLFRDVLLGVKDEMRRSFKDNGFYELNNSDFLSFIKDRTAIIQSMFDQYIRNIFPDNASIIKPQDLIDIFEKEKDFLSIIFNDIYSYARNVKLEAENRIEEMKNSFKKWIDEFIKLPPLGYVYIEKDKGFTVMQKSVQIDQ